MPMQSAQSNIVPLRPRAWSATAAQEDGAQPGARPTARAASAELAARLARAAATLPADWRQAPALGDALARWRDLYERSPVGLLVLSRGGVVMRANATALAMLAPGVQDLVGTALADRCTPRSAECLAEHLKALQEDAGLDYCELDIVDGPAAQRPVCLATLDVGDGMDGPLRSALLDISGFRETEAGLALAASVVEHTSQGVVVTDAAYRIVAVNPAFTAITGYGADEVLGQLPTVFQSDPDETGAPPRAVCALRERGYWQGEIRSHRKNGEPYPQWVTVSEIRGERGDPTRYVCMISDMTSQDAARAELFALAYFDTLTGLPNRVNLLDRLSRALVAARRDKRLLGVLYLDLDRFKEVNDTFGHAVGDRLLQHVARELKDTVRQTDLVARLGGDELAVLVPDLKNAQAAGRIAGNIVQRFERRPLRVDAREIHTSVSIGIALFPKDADDSEGLLECADAAMYAAKAAGRSGFRFHSGATAARYRQGDPLESDLRRAIARNELCLLYRTQVCLRSFRIVGCECLLGWQRGDHGPVERETFLPLAHKTELIVPFERWVLDTLAEQSPAACAPVGADFRFSIPISPVLLGAPHLEPFLRQLGEVSQRLGSRVELEICESHLADGHERGLRTLARIRALGIGLALDRWGTGPACLRDLKGLPLSRVKLDAGLVRDLETDADCAPVVAASIAVAHTFGLEVIAQGVATARQLDALRALGCDQAQGILFGPPVGRDTLRELLERASPESPDDNAYPMVRADRCEGLGSWTQRVRGWLRPFLRSSTRDR